MKPQTKPAARRVKKHAHAPESHAVEAEVAQAVAAVVGALELSSDEINNFSLIGRGTWRGERDGAVIVVEREKESGGFRASAERGGIRANASTRGYVSAARAAIRELNEKTATAK